MRHAWSCWIVLALGCGAAPHSADQPLSSAGATSPEAKVGASAGAEPTRTVTSMRPSTQTAGRQAEAGAAAAGGRSDAGSAASQAGMGGAAPVSSGGAGGGAAPADAGAAATAGAGGAATGGAGGIVASVPVGEGPAQSRATGYGRAASGGGGAKPQRVATLAALQAAVDAYAGSGGLVLEYTGKFDFQSIADPCVQHMLPAQKLEIKKKSDITLRGTDGSSANFGIHVASSAHNIVIRNMTIGLLPGGGDSDMISLEGMSSGVPSDIWIDHNELFSSLADCPGAGDTEFDGMIDIKKGADNVTISYNYLHDHHKVSLNGYSDSDDAVRHVTFDHNWFENVGSRTPLQRHGYAHVLNNYFGHVLVSGINVRMGGYALIEGNYFEHVRNPVTSRDSSSVGYWDLRDNNLMTQADVAPGNAYDISWDDGNDGTRNATDWTTTQAFPQPLGYDYQADSFACVRDGLRAVVGPGKGLSTLACR